MMKAEKNHSSVNSHFEGRDPVVRQIYNEILKCLRRFGPITEDPKKTSIHLVRDTAVAGIATRNRHLVLTIKSDHKLSSARIHKTQQASANRYYSEIKLASPEEVNEDVQGWLRHAYAVAALQNRR
jgi:hypothetical protein